jgi:hypothetical protein
MRSILNFSVVNRCPNFTYLGVTIDSNLNFKQHVLDLRKSLAPVTGVLYRLRNILDIKSKCMIYHALFHSRWIYAIVAWGQMSMTSWNSLERSQRKCLSYVFGNANELKPCTAAPIDAQLNYRRCLLVHASLRKEKGYSFPFRFTQMITYTTRYNDSYHLIKDYFRLAKTHAAFLVKCIDAFNALPDNLRELVHMDDFKFILRNHLLMAPWKHF